MEHRIDRLLERRRWVICVFLVASLLCTLLMLGVRVNFDMTDYLPADANSTKAISVMQREFSGAMPNARAMVDTPTIGDALSYKIQLSAVDGVSEVLWLDDVIDLTIPLEWADTTTVEGYYKDGKAIFSFVIDKEKASAVTDAVYGIIGENGALSGDGVDMAIAQRMSTSETRRAMVLLVPIILVVLLLSTSSWLEPLLFLGAIGVSLLLNMGTNVLQGEVSFITNAVTPILQMAVSLDYSIFLLHNFEAYRKTNLPVQTAMVRAVRRSMVVVVASSMTTLFGFLVLCFMDFRIGMDLGLSLSKGILTSLFSALLFLPCLTISLHKILEKTRHKILLPSFAFLGKLGMKLRVPALLLALLAVTPAYLGQAKNAFSYGMGALDAESRAGRDTRMMEEIFGASVPIALLVPRGNIVAESELTKALGDIPYVDAVVSYTNMVGQEIPPDYLTERQRSQFYSEHYARIILYAQTDTEGDAAFSVVKQVREAAAQWYGSNALVCGMPANLYDIKEVVTQDNQRVNLLAILAIGLIVLLSFRSLSLPVILLLTIETAIWLNLSIPYFSGMTINYIGYLVMNTVQLGATVDYAILLSDHYMENRKKAGKREAILLSLLQCTKSILVSGGTLSTTGFLLGMVSTNGLVSGLGFLLGQGTLFSIGMVLFVLPALLTLLDGIIRKSSMRTAFLEEPLKPPATVEEGGKEQ